MNLTYHGLDSCIKFFKCHKNLLQNLMYNNNYIMIKYIHLPSHSMRLWGTLQERTCMYMKHEIYTFSMNSHMLCTYFIKKYLLCTYFIKKYLLCTFILPDLLPNFSVKTLKESIIPTGSGAGLLISAKASLIRMQSNL